MAKAATTRTAPCGRLTLGYGDIHIWLVSAAGPDVPEKRLEGLLSPAERQSCLRMVRVRDRRRFFTVRAALRSTLATYLRMPPPSISIAYSPSGKPFLESQPDPSRPLHFNVSHAGDLALIAVSRGFRVGIDVEPTCETRAFHDILEDFFGPSEQSWVQSLAGETQTEAFFRAWTRREAACKAVGIGLIESFARFDFPAPGYSPSGFSLQLPPSSQTGDSRDWWIRDLDPAAGCVGALCVEEANPTPVFCEFDW